MEKLIELLNEYENTLEPNLQIEWTEVWIKSTPEIVISKKFWFIKWLDENNKIDCNKSIFTVDWDYGRDDVIYEIERQDYYILNEQYWVGSTDCILMLLSISDTPIEDLVSYLK
jgi:hypothetical protein